MGKAKAQNRTWSKPGLSASWSPNSPALFLMLLPLLLVSDSKQKTHACTEKSSCAFTTQLSAQLASRLCLGENSTTNQKLFSSIQLWKSKNPMLRKAKDDSGEFGPQKTPLPLSEGKQRPILVFRAQ